MSVSSCSLICKNNRSPFWPFFARIRMTYIMKKTTTILIILLLATVVGGVFAFSYFLQQRLHSNASPNVSPLDAARVEDLVKKSAQQIEDPSLATVPEDQQDNHQQPAQNTFPCSQSTNFNCYDKYYRGIVKDK